MTLPARTARRGYAQGLVPRRVPDATTTQTVALPNIGSANRLDERRLVESARHDANAFAELYRLYVDRIHGYCMRRSGSRQIAEDVTSATFEKALRGLATYRWREPGIGPWLFRIASNELVNHYRSDSRQTKAARSLSLTADLTTSDRAFDATNLGASDEVIAALGKIRPRYQRALTLRFFADLSNEEAAVAMGVSRATMAVVVHRGAAALRKVIEASRKEGSLSNG